MLGCFPIKINSIFFAYMFVHIHILYVIYWIYVDVCINIDIYICSNC